MTPSPQGTDRRIIGFTRKASFSDVLCLLLARTGQSAKSIARQTGLSVPAVGYRCHVAGIRLRDYRNGDSDFAKKVIECARQEAQVLSAQIVDDLAQIRKALADS